MAYKVDGKNAMLDHLRTLITHVSLHTAFPATPANEIVGGSPAYARQAISFNAAAGGAIDDSGAAKVFNVPAGSTVAAAGFWTAVSGGTLLADSDLVDEVYAGQGTYTLTDADLDLNQS